MAALPTMGRALRFAKSSRPSFWILGRVLARKAESVPVILSCTAALRNGTTAGQQRSSLHHTHSPPDPPVRAFAWQRWGLVAAKRTLTRSAKGVETRRRRLLWRYTHGTRNAASENHDRNRFSPVPGG